MGQFGMKVVISLLILSTSPLVTRSGMISGFKLCYSHLSCVNSESLSSSQANPHLMNDMLSTNKFSLSAFTASFLTKLNLKLY